MRLNQSDTVFCKDRISLRLTPFTVMRVTDTQAVLENGAKLSRELEDGQFYPVPRATNTPCMYIPFSDSAAEEYHSQSDNTESIIEKTNGWMRSFNPEMFFKSNSTGLVFALFLLIAQTLHSGHSLTSLSRALNYSSVFGYVSALFLDALILFFLANGAKWSSWVAMITCVILNLYSYHFGYDWGSYDSWFSILPSIAIPYSIHRVGSVILKNNMI